MLYVVFRVTETFRNGYDVRTAIFREDILGVHFELQFLSSLKFLHFSTQVNLAPISIIKEMHGCEPPTLE